MQWKRTSKDPTEKKTFEEKTYQWCGAATGGKCERYVMHKPSNCQGNTFKRWRHKKCSETGGANHNSPPKNAVVAEFNDGEKKKRRRVDFAKSAIRRDSEHTLKVMEARETNHPNVTNLLNDMLLESLARTIKCSNECIHTAPARIHHQLHYQVSPNYPWYTRKGNKVHSQPKKWRTSRNQTAHPSTQGNIGRETT